MDALSALGIELEKPSFPTTNVCPFCRQNDLYLFDDIVTNCVWLFCNACKVHGDIITFGSQIWNTSLPDTLQKFSDLNLAATGEVARNTPEYVRFAAKLNTAEQFWTEVAEQLWNHGDDVIATRLREFGIKYEINDCAGLVGVAHYDQITRLCAALGRPKPLRSREDGAAIVYPFYDLPYRLTGFLIAQYNEAFEVRQTFIPLSGFKKRRPEAGYFMLHKLLAPANEQFRGHHFVSEDLHWSVKAQVKNSQKGMQPLPLVVSYSGPEAESYGTSWQAFNNAPRIFHGPTFSPTLISRACNAKGYVSVVALRQPTEAANLISMRSHTKPWQDALKTALLRADEINALAFAEKLTIPHDRLSLFLGKLEHPFSAGFADRVLAEVVTAPAEPYKKWLVIERDNGWWNHIGRQISNIRPQIEKIIQTDDGEKIYVGTITADDGEKFTFSDSAKKIEALGLLGYSDAVLAPHKKLVIYDKLWNARSHLFALQLHQPEIVNLSTRYGWDARNRVFRFDTYEITDTGEFRKTPPWPKKGIISFENPLPVAPLPLRDFLTPAHENSYIWNLVASVLGHLIAPVLNVDPAATGIGQQDFRTALAVAKALCCPVARATSAHKPSAHGFFARFNKDIPWPTLTYNTFGDEIFSNIVPRYFNCAITTRLSPPALAVAPGYGWQTLIPGTQNDRDVAVLNYVVPAYIQHVLAARVQMFKKTEHLHRQILKSLHGWLLETYGTSFNLAHALTTVREPDDAHTALLEGLKPAFSSGKIQILPVPRRRDQAKNYIVQEKENWWLNRHAVDRYFYLERAIAPNWLSIIDLLQRHGIYAGERTIHNMTGLLIRREWCQQFWPNEEPNVEQETG